MLPCQTRSVYIMEGNQKLWSAGAWSQWDGRRGWSKQVLLSNGVFNNTIIMSITTVSFTAFTLPVMNIAWLKDVHHSTAIIVHCTYCLCHLCTHKHQSKFTHSEWTKTKSGHSFVRARFPSPFFGFTLPLSARSRFISSAKSWCSLLI